MMWWQPPTNPLNDDQVRPPLLATLGLALLLMLRALPSSKVPRVVGCFAAIGGLMLVPCVGFVGDNNIILGLCANWISETFVKIVLSIVVDSCR